MKENQHITYSYLSLYLDLVGTALGHETYTLLTLAIEGRQQAQREYEEVMAEISVALGLEKEVTEEDLRMELELAYYQRVDQIEELGLKLEADWVLNTQIVHAKLASLKAQLELMKAQVGAGAVVKFDDYIAKQEQLNTFAAAVEQYKKYDELQHQLLDAQDAAGSALMLVNVLAKKEGLTLRIGAENDVAFAVNDLFIFGDHASTLFDFGAEGTDLFYFGPNYQFIHLDPSTDIATTPIGDPSQLEVFLQQNGKNLTLYVETESIEGSSQLGFQGETINLIGVDAEQITTTPTGVFFLS